MSQVARIIEAVAKVDAGAADEMCRVALYETLLDVIEDHRDSIEQVVKSDLAVQSVAMRRELVRQFVDARMAKRDVQPLLQAAAQLSLIDYEVAKDDGDAEAYERQHNIQHGAGGRWVAIGGRTKEGERPAAVQNANLITGLMRPRENLRNAHPAYQTASFLGRALQATGHPGASSAGIVLDVAGQMGPEAEKVLGDHMARFAYRYRGTERRPDAQLTAEMRRTSHQTAGLTSPEESKVTAAETLEGAEHTRRGLLSPHLAIARFNAERGQDEHLSRDQVLMDSQADVATAYLMGQVPNLEHARLSVAAGKMPPSEGVMINRDGRVVSQAMGFNGDHYLPFDLKNVGRMHGGQYVRTRSQGGLTTEDVYTGLMSGARQVTVVSNSGVFTMEFDPDLRGGRRYNDKARQMVDRYQQMLEAIHGNKVTAGQIPDAEMRRIRTEALEQGGGDEDYTQQLYDRKLKELQFGELFRGQDESYRDQARSESLHEAQFALQSGAKQGQYSTQSIARRTQELEGEKAKEAAAQNYRQVRLDAHGYYRAMQALQTEFPYFVRRVDYTPTEKWQQERGLVSHATGDVRHRGASGTDMGYVNAQTHLALGRARRHGRAAATATTDQAEAKPGMPKTPSGAAVAPTTASKSWGNAEHLSFDQQDRLRDQMKPLPEEIVRDRHADEPTYTENFPLSRVKDAAQLAFWEQDNGPGALAKAFKDMSATEQDAFLDKLESRKMATDESVYNYQSDTEKQDQNDRLAARAEALRTLHPFSGPVADQDLSKRPSRPIEVPEIMAAGPDRDKLRQFKHSQTTVQQNKINEYADMDREGVLDDLEDLQTHYRRLYAQKQAGQPAPDLEQAGHELLYGQKAFAYVTAKKIANDAAGVGPGSPKASALSAGLTRHRQVAAKRYQPTSPLPGWQKLAQAVDLLLS